MVTEDELLEWLQAQLRQERDPLGVALSSLIEETIRPWLGVADTTQSRNARIALKLLASGYADRAGYRREWRP